MNLTTKILCAVSVSGIVVLPSRAGVAIQAQVTDLRAGGKSPTTQEILIDGARIRMGMGETSSFEGKNDVIFRGDKNVLWNIQHRNQSYTELNEESFDQVGQQMNEAMKNLEEQMANAPPEQRAMIEGMMKKMMPAQDAVNRQPEPSDVRKTGETQTIDGHPCTKYEVYRGGALSSEVWATSWQHAGVAKSTFDVFSNLADFYEGMLSAMGTGPKMGGAREAPFRDFESIDGYPILIRKMEKGTPVEETRLQLPEVRDVDPAGFEPPAGYRKLTPGTR